MQGYKIQIWVYNQIKKCNLSRLLQLQQSEEAVAPDARQSVHTQIQHG
jgi:hypothetical protein